MNTQPGENRDKPGEQGFEPQYRDPEPRVLPLDDSPIYFKNLIRGFDLCQVKLERYTNSAPNIHIVALHDTPLILQYVRQLCAPFNLFCVSADSYLMSYILSQLTAILQLLGYVIENFAFVINSEWASITLATMAPSSTLSPFIAR